MDVGESTNDVDESTLDVGELTVGETTVNRLVMNAIERVIDYHPFVRKGNFTKYARIIGTWSVVI